MRRLYNHRLNVISRHLYADLTSRLPKVFTGKRHEFAHSKTAMTGVGRNQPKLMHKRLMAKALYQVRRRIARHTGQKPYCIPCLKGRCHARHRIDLILDLSGDKLVIQPANRRSTLWRYHPVTTTPPSMTKACPVIMRLALDARNKTPSTISCGAIGSGKHCRDRCAARSFSFTQRSFCFCVMTQPGATAFTRI